MSLQTGELANGLRVVTERMPSMGSASLGIWIAAGCRHETEHENGIAHFLEHMAFKGTETRTAAQIAEEIETVGGYLNAYTSRETTAYYARVLGEDVPLAMTLIADILRTPRFEAPEIAVERGVILQEIGQALDTPDDVIFDWLQEVSYPGQPMGRPILGLADRVSRFDAGDLRRFVAGHYAPNRMVLSAAGDVDHDAIMRMAERLYGDMAAGGAGKAEPARFEGGERRETRKLEQAHLALAFEAPGHSAPDVYAAQIFATTLGGGMSSRLFQEIREKRGLCYTIFAQASAYQDTGALTVYAGTGAGEIAALTELVADQIRACVDGLTEPEIARARAQMKAGMVMGLESPSNRAERHARCLEIWGRVPSIAEVVERIEAVDVRAARDVGQKMLSSAAPALALYGPVEAAPGREAIAARLAA